MNSCKLLYHWKDGRKEVIKWVVEESGGKGEGQRDEGEIWVGVGLGGDMRAGRT